MDYNKNIIHEQIDLGRYKKQRRLGYAAPLRLNLIKKEVQEAIRESKNGILPGEDPVEELKALSDTAL